jgi:hypothetical protein|tara:strand:- start:93 stop:353 length:261 start_codon:yes stop_codon:yes gene_type:complete
MEQFLKTVSKLFTMGALIIILLVILGSIFTQQVRSNVVTLADDLSSSGLTGLAVTILLLYMFKDVPSQFYKLIKAKGFNKKFWDSL